VLGHRLVDRYLEFVAGRSRPNTLRAVAFDLKEFFAVVGKDPVEVTAVDVFEFVLSAARGDRRPALGRCPRWGWQRLGPVPDSRPEEPGGRDHRRTARYRAR
jgi:hypothetical protein